MRRFRTVWKFLVPGWLQRGHGELVQWVEGLILDAWIERCHQTGYLMLPSLAPDDALDRIGADRAIPRGLFEPEGSYRERLVRWRYPRGHRIRGGALALLEQVTAALRGTTHQTIDARGTRYAAGTDAAERGVAWDWDGTGFDPAWGRYWLVVESTGERWPSFADGAWGPTVLGGEDVCVGMSGVHPGEVDAVRKLTKPGSLSWTPAGRRAIYLIFYFAGDPYPVPDGTWDEWPNRDEAYRYVPLTEHVT